MIEVIPFSSYRKIDADAPGQYVVECLRRQFEYVIRLHRQVNAILLDKSPIQMTLIK